MAHETGRMKPLRISENFLRKIFEQAEKEYPNECCGMIFGARDLPEDLSRLRPCRNVQDEYRAKDPRNFSRTAQTAFSIDASELLSIQKEIRGRGEEIRVIYHSHIDTGAYFSEEDHRLAAPEGTPAYPGVQHLVVSVVCGKIADQKIFRWDEGQKKYLP